MIWAPLLLADSSPCLRLIVLRDLLERPDEDEEVQEISKLQMEDPLYTELFKLQEKDGWIIQWQPIKAGRKVKALRFEFERDPQGRLL